MSNSCSLLKALAVLLALSGGAAHAEGWKLPPGQYSSLRDYLVREFPKRLDQTRPDVPYDVKVRFAACIVDMVLANVTPVQMKKLDAAARGETVLDEDEGQKIIQQIKGAIVIPTRGDFSQMEPYCPEDIPTFKKYVRQ